jgi:3-phosphoshikimate 1-carboxyvinyltransferase
MAFAIAGLFADGETTITNTECVQTSYPGFEKQLEEVTRASLQPQTQVISIRPHD